MCIKSIRLARRETRNANVRGGRATRSRHSRRFDEGLYEKEVMKIPGVAKPASPFNHVVKAGNFLFLSSQLSVDLHTHTLLKGTTAEQTRQALKNIKFLLESCGAEMTDIVKVVVYMRDAQQFHEMNRVYGEYFQEGEEPARVAIQAQSPLAGIDIEIEAIAVVPERKKK
jgi:2-iminobutanoate/2-iminopropanoate deaminase